MATKKKAAPKKPARKKTVAKKAPAAPLRGQFVWYELLTTDPGAAKRFYTAVVGWGTMPFGQDPSYTMWTNKGAPLGGVMALPEEARRMRAPSNWMAHISTPDVDATVRQAAAMGAKILKPPADIPGAGRFAIIQDPQGAVFGAYRSNQPGAKKGDPKIGEISWHELATTDAVAAFKFYSALFGWVKTDAMDSPMGIYQMYGLEQTKPLGGMMNKTPDLKGPPFWCYYIKVDSADRAAERAKSLGAKVISGPMDVPGGGRIAQCIDPQGAVFALHSVPS